MRIKTVHVKDCQSHQYPENGFFVHHRYVLENEYEDGSRSRTYRTEFFDRKGIDCVAVIPYRVSPQRVEIGILKAFRPCMYLRKDRDLAVDEERRYWMYESVAGSLEVGDRGADGISHRAAAELAEEAGFQVPLSKLQPLGAGFFPSHGQCTEKIHLFAVDVTGLTPGRAAGDGSVNEELNELVFMERDQLKQMCFRGEVEDPKIEIGLNRLDHVL